MFPRPFGEKLIFFRFSGSGMQIKGGQNTVSITTPSWSDTSMVRRGVGKRMWFHILLPQNCVQKLRCSQVEIGLTWQGCVAATGLEKFLLAWSLMLGKKSFFFFLGQQFTCQRWPNQRWPTATKVALGYQSRTVAYKWAPKLHFDHFQLISLNSYF